jgi:hypothetical protein
VDPSSTRYPKLIVLAQIEELMIVVISRHGSLSSLELNIRDDNVLDRVGHYSIVSFKSTSHCGFFVVQV